MTKWATFWLMTAVWLGESAVLLRAGDTDLALVLFVSFVVCAAVMEVSE